MHSSVGSYVGVRDCVPVTRGADDVRLVLFDEAARDFRSREGSLEFWISSSIVGVHIGC